MSARRFRGVGWLGLGLGVWLAVGAQVPAHGQELYAPGAKLETQTDPGGGVRAHAVVLLPANRLVVQRVLTDFARWPELFETKMRMAKVDGRDDHVVTELFIAHPILPSESRLLSDNRLHPDGMLTTTFLEGDFKRYARTWRLTETSASETRAEFDLVMEAKTLVPDWVVAILLKKELDTHFKLLRERIVSVAKQP